VRPKLESYPDFEARSREIFGDKMVDQTGAELLAWERDRY
jgi:hypothetical protein